MQEKILIVDDDIDTLRLVGLMLQRQGYQIVAATHGSQALRMAKSEAPDLILLDIMMPDLDGYEVTRRLRKDAETRDIPILLFTAKSQAEDRATGFEAGADGYLVKPIQPGQLFEQVEEILDRMKSSSPTKPVPRGLVTGILATRGGLGISTLAVNLGYTLYTKRQQKVIVAEFRPGEGSMALDLGLPDGDSLNQLLEMEPSTLSAEVIEAALVEHSTGIRLLPSSYHPRDSHYRSLGDELSAIAAYLPDLASFVVLDLGPGIYPATEKVLERCDQLIVAFDSFPHSIPRTEAMMGELAAKGFGKDRVNCVLINRTRLDGSLTLTQAQEQLHWTVGVAFSPAPDLAYLAAKENQPLVSLDPTGPLAQQFTRLAESLGDRTYQTA